MRQFQLSFTHDDEQDDRSDSEMTAASGEKTGADEAGADEAAMRPFAPIEARPAAEQRPAPGPSRSEPDPEAAQEILGGLNEAQQEAVAATDGPVLIIAGPGSGKTRTLTHRIAYLIAAGKAQPWQILALTFTNKAAREMKERIGRLAGPEAGSIWMGTFHSVCARLLRREADKLGYTRDFSIYDTDDSERILKGLMERHHIDSQQVRPRAIRSIISSAKNQMVSPEKYAKMATGTTQEAAARLFGPYQEALRRANAMDFDDLLLKPIELFEQNEELLQKYQRRWSYVHIDEYQDTNHAQYVLAKMLAAGHENLCVVGDDAQSIYAFRGADIQNILNFQRDYPEATTVRLEQNYRSTKTILRLADSIIKQNEAQLDKSLWTDNDQGEHVVLMEGLSEKDEAKKIESRIRDLHIRKGYGWGEFAVLYRTNAQSRALEDAMRRGGIPYQVIGGVSFYQRKEIKDAVAYLQLLVNPNDTASLQRVINYPTRGIGAKTQERVQNYANRQGISLWQAVDTVEQVNTLSTRAKNAVESFRTLIGKYASHLGSRPADELARDLLDEAGLFAELRKDGTEENLMRWENVQELLNGIAEYVASTEEATLATFLQEIMLLTDMDRSGDGTNQVTMMTLHASKGLEFPVVFVAGLEEDLFPLKKAAEEPDGLEEERRLLYVGATRAEDRLFLSYARSRFRYGKQDSSVRSRFLDELDQSVLRTETGGRYKAKKNRFKAKKKQGRSVEYDNLDPHYYRKNLRKETRKKSSGGGRRVVYDEGFGQISTGDQVEHEHFGEGKVISMSGRGDQATAVVFFPDVGQKKLKLKYANLRRVDL